MPRNKKQLLLGSPDAITREIPLLQVHHKPEITRHSDDWRRVS